MKKYVGLSAVLPCFSKQGSMRKAMLCLALVSVCALLPSVAAAQKKQLPTMQQLSVAPEGASICDADPNNLVLNCGFESNMFPPNWTQSGDPSFTGIQGPPVNHSGNFGVFSGPVNSLGFITQQIPTDPSALYDLSFWLRNAQIPNRFQVIWNGAVIYDQTNMPDFPYTSSDLLPVGDPTVFIGLVPSDGDTTELTFGFFNVPDFFWFDDVDVVQE